MKYISFDVETTGTDLENCQILSLGAIIEDTNNQLSFDLIPKFHCYFIQRFIHGQPKALVMNSKIIEIISNYLEIKTSAEKLNYLSTLNVMLLELGHFTNAFKDFLRDNKYSDVHEEKKGLIYINAVGKNLNGFDLKFIQDLPNFTQNFRIRQRTGDPSLYYVNWFEDETFPSLDTCLERSNEKKKIVSHDALEDAWQVICLLRENYSKK